MAITLMGMYNYDNSLFQYLQLPTGLNRQVCIDNILMRYGEFESLYGNPEFIKNSIDMFSKKWLPTFEKWYDGWIAEYNPIENYDRYEDITDTSANANVKNNTGTASTDTNNSSSDVEQMLNNSVNTSKGASSDTSTNSTNSVNENQVSAFNSTSYENKDKSTTTGGNNTVTQSLNDTDSSQNDVSSRVNTNSQNGNESVNNSSSEISTGTGSNKRIAHIHGNIGVTTASQMLDAHYSISAWNIYDNIADVFATEYIIPVY